MASKLKEWSWKFFGALFMRDKGSNGTPSMAISAHKTIGMAFFVACLGIWLLGGTHLSHDELVKLLEAGKAIPSKWGTPPDMLVYSMWAGLGLKGVFDVVEKFRR